MLNQSLPKLVDTYKNVCGDNNPFSAVPNMGSWGATSLQYQTFMLVFHDTMPVMNDYTRLAAQIQCTILENESKYNAMYAAQLAAAALDPTAEFDYTEETSRTGHDDLTKSGSQANTRTGNVSNSGTDSTTDTSSITDSTTTYDNGTLRDTAKTQHGGGPSVTYGKVTTYNSVADTTTFTNRKDETAYNSTFTKSVTGHKTGPAEIMKQYTDFVRENNVFAEIISDIVRALSCIVYIPYYPNNEEE